VLAAIALSPRNAAHKTLVALNVNTESLGNAAEWRGLDPAKAAAPAPISPATRYLLINAGRVLTRSQILDHVWHYDFGGDASVLETYVSYLRRKVDKHDPPLIQTVRGVGYVLRTPRK